MSASPLTIVDDNSVTPVRHDGDVTVDGIVREGRDFHVGGSLTVAGAVEAAQLYVGHALSAGGGVIGRGRGRYTVGGDLRCRFITDAAVSTRGDVLVSGDVAHTRLTCVGRLELPGGVLFGGDVSANGGVACRALGNAAGVTTVVEAGTGRALRLLSETIVTRVDADRQRVNTLRATVNPLLGRLKQLSPQQREKATELIYEAEELEASIASLLAAFDVRRRLVNERARPEIRVADTVHAGVFVRFGPIEAPITAAMRGPLTFTVRKTESSTAVVIIDGVDGSTCDLPSRSVEPVAAAA